ncbi:uncharacterized protein LOC127862677 isoform X2 [Dreissena polymorpha]|nr:uncharacterized protein LOC127862677 isoform X2 [Dreissena polymorpha]
MSPYISFISGLLLLLLSELYPRILVMNRENQIGDENKTYGIPPWPNLGRRGEGNGFVGHDTSRIDAIPTPPPIQKADSGLPVVHDSVSVFQVAALTSNNPNFPPEEHDSLDNNVAQSAMHPYRVPRVGFNKTQCTVCNLKTIRFSQKSCGHVVCGECLAPYEGMPCKICKQPVIGIHQIDANVFA